MSIEQPPRPRVVVKKGHGGGHHGGAWKVAYADFVTTMMALFIVLWIIGQSEGTREAIAKYFRDPGAFRQGASPSLLSGGAGVLPPGVPPSGAEGEGQGKAAEERALQAAAAEFSEALKDMGLFESLKDQIRIEVTAEGLRIEMMERDHVPFFRVGSPVIIHPMKPLLERMAGILAKLPNQITIEGHTDARRYGNRDGYSNWELSTDRAHSARKAMETAGLSNGRVDSIIGHADRVLLVPSHPLHASNRRISVLVRRQHQG